MSDSSSSKRSLITVVGDDGGMGGEVCDSNVQGNSFARVLIFMHRATVNQDVRRLVLTIGGEEGIQTSDINPIAGPDFTINDCDPVSDAVVDSDAP
mgnify:CR=1 FL=1